MKLKTGLTTLVSLILLMLIRFGFCNPKSAATWRVLFSESNHVFVSEPQGSGKTVEDYNVSNVFKMLILEAILDEFCDD